VSQPRLVGGSTGLGTRSRLAEQVRKVAAHVVVDDLSSPRLAGDDAHHLGAVLRLRAGEPVGATDGRGGWRLCRYAGPSSGRRGVAVHDGAADGGLEAHGEIQFEQRPSPALTVAFVPVKGDRPEWAIQKLAELGVDRIVVMRSERSVVRWAGDRASSHVDRLLTVARQAVMQSRQLWLPDVVGPEDFASVASWPGAALAAPEGDPPSLDRPVILIGPEGGWSDEEAAAGLPVVTLGPAVLRAETAAVVAGALLSSMRVGVCRPA
jgi:16S rRNA (uracil1498-N3)-methyltransferase